MKLCHGGIHKVRVSHIWPLPLYFLGGDLHFAGTWAEALEGLRLVLAVLVRLVEEHPEIFVEQKPCRQTEQPLGETREGEGRGERR